MATSLQQSPCILEKIHQAAQCKRVRFNEFFKDFDRLRTGEITESQFKRCINQSFGLTVSEKDFNQIKEQYGSFKKVGMINYRNFINVMEKDGFQNKLNKPSSNSTQDLRAILMKLKYHHHFRGILISDCFEDFDRHNSGLVTESQFWRCFPSVPGLEAQGIRYLIDTYRHNNTNLINYINFQKDIDKQCTEDPDETVHHSQPPSLSITPSPSPCKTVEELLEKVQLRVYKDGIRTTEFFIDHDKLRSGFITKNQFIIGLNLICGMRCPLSRDEIERIAEYYIAPNGRVCYREFCFFMENAFNVPHLETNPTATINRPCVGALANKENKLSAEDEVEVQCVLDVLRDFVTRRRITLLYPFFKDFDRGKLFSRGVTKHQFRRLLDFFDVSLSQRECDLICKKFVEPNGTDVNYPAFVQAIDKDYIVTRDSNDTEVTKKEARAPTPRSPKLQPELVNIPKLIEQLQCEVKVYGIRVCEHFKDFDGLKSGSISKSLFKRGLASMQGNHYNLTPSDLEAICIYYRDPKVPGGGNVRWSNFEQDVEKVITERNLEKKPKFRVKPTDHITLNSCNPERQISIQEHEIGNVAVDRMRQKIAQRRIMTKPCFQDFDRHHCGYTSPTQFEQGLTYLGLESNGEERKALKAMYGDAKGIDYHKFFNDLDPTAHEPPKYEKNLAAMARHNKFREEGKRHGGKNGYSTVEAVLDKIKEIVMKKRIRLLEFFIDYDKLRSGRILRTNFKRALDLSGLGLTMDEIDLIAEKYQSLVKDDCVFYQTFNDEIESIFTDKGLENSPTAQVIQYKIMPEWLKNNLSKPIQAVCDAAMEGLARYLKTRRMQLYPMFEDYDKCRNGTVTYSQFRRVLSVLRLAANEVEFHALEKKYTVNVGGMNVFNYLAFCDDIYDIAKLDKLD